MIAFFPDGSIQQKQNICSCKRCLRGLFVHCMFEKVCREASKVIVSEKPEEDSDKEESNLKMMSYHMTQSMIWFKKKCLLHCINSLTLQNYFMFAKF